MNKLIKIILLLAGGLIITCFTLVLLPLLLIMLMLWMIFGGSRLRVFKGDKKSAGHEYDAGAFDAEFSEAPPEPEEFSGFLRENNDIIDITAREVKDKE
jgi:hypothetical protein